MEIKRKGYGQNFLPLYLQIPNLMENGNLSHNCRGIFSDNQPFPVHRRWLSVRWNGRKPIATLVPRVNCGSAQYVFNWPRWIQARAGTTAIVFTAPRRCCLIGNRGSPSPKEVSLHFLADRCEEEAIFSVQGREKEEKEKEKEEEGLGFVYSECDLWSWEDK